MRSLSFLYSPGRIQRLAAARRGESPTEFFYGALELEKRGVDVRIVEADPLTPPHWPCAALNFIGQNGPIKLDGHVAQAAYDALPAVKAGEVAVGTTGAHAFALALLKWTRRHATPVVGIQCGLLNHPINRWRRLGTVALLRRMESMLFGEGEREPMLEAYPGIGDRLHVNQFGVDERFWTPGPARESGYVLAVGSDGRRDYDVLMAAARRVDVPFVVVTEKNRLHDPPANVRHLEGAFWDGPSDLELRDLYRGAACVVTPLQPTRQPSGQSVTLQAMACGRPVALSDVEGLWSRETLRDRETLLLAPPGDAAALAERIREVLADSALASRLGSAAREAVCRHATIGQFADRLLDICQKALEREGGA